MRSLTFVLCLYAFVVFCYRVSSRSTGVQKRSNVCYDDLGCFSTGSPFLSLYRPVNFLPDRPEKINTRFKLFTRTSKDVGKYIHANDFNSITSSRFSGSRPTKIISHGFLENGNVDWLQDMKNEFLKAGDFNVIIVGWGGGSGLPYTQATANTRVVGAEVAKLITVLQSHGSAHTEDIHVIGHSLGAHIAGYAGERTRNLGRITGLDPAEPYFQYTDIAVRLDPTDAMFVDVIHTDGESILKLGFGMIQPCGHVDYYPNSGENQPGCDKGVVDQLRLEGDIYNGGKEYIACNHLRSYKYFTESINSACPWMGYQCDSYEDFKRGVCMPCSGSGCGQMGFHADLHKPRSRSTNAKYYLETGDVGPFCRYHYLFRISFGNPSGAQSWSGKLYGNIHGSNGQLGQTLLSDLNIQPGKSYGFVIASSHDVGTIHDATVFWQHEHSLLNPLTWNPFNLRHPTVFVSNLEVVNGEMHRRVNFCGSNTKGIETQQTMMFSNTC